MFHLRTWKLRTLKPFHELIRVTLRKIKWAHNRAYLNTYLAHSRIFRCLQEDNNQLNFLSTWWGARISNYRDQICVQSIIVCQGPSHSTRGGRVNNGMWDEPKVNRSVLINKLYDQSNHDKYCNLDLTWIRIIFIFKNGMKAQQLCCYSCYWLS